MRASALAPALRVREGNLIWIAVIPVSNAGERADYKRVDDAISVMQCPPLVDTRFSESVYWRDVTLSDEATVPLPQLMYEEDFSQRWSG